MSRTVISMSNRIAFDCGNNTEIALIRNPDTGEVTATTTLHFRDGASSLGVTMSAEHIRYLKLFLNREGPYADS